MSTPELQALHEALTALTQLERGKAVSQTKVRAVAAFCFAARDSARGSPGRAICEDGAGAL